MFILKHILHKGFCFQMWLGEVESYTSYTDQLCFLPRLGSYLSSLPSGGGRVCQMARWLCHLFTPSSQTSLSHILAVPRPCYLYQQPR